MTAENSASWQESIDITGKKEGKYNFLITADDMGGNIAITGPFNIWIDPNSDLPVTGITNPLQDMRVPGNLNIVGTCIDDDAVDYVEIILDGDTANPIRADGKEFWSYYLDTTELIEGSHTITVTGVDIYGVQGKPVSVTWHLDRNQPETGIINYTLGTLVSGKITLEGTVFDGNGIQSLSYSLDRGETFDSIRLKKEKGADIWNFSLVLDTTKIDDGPAVCWFRSVDEQGSVGIYTFLYFIDNTKPDVFIHYPLPADEVNGLFTAAGYAGDIIGLDSLSWTMGKESGYFELVPGNRYWVKEFDLRGQQIRSADIEITAIDTAGNRQSIKQRLNINQKADLPTVTIRTPADGEILFDPPLLTGIVTDDDGAAEVWYSLDGAGPVLIETDGVFQSDFNRSEGFEFLPGQHTLEVWAVDIHGIQGEAVSLGFITAGSAPMIQSQGVSRAKQEINESYHNGMEIHPESGSTFNLSLSSGMGIVSSEWRFSGQEPVTQVYKKAVPSVLLQIPFSQSLPYGVVELDVAVTDIYERRTERSFLFHITNLAVIRDGPEVILMGDTADEGSPVILDRMKPLQGYFAGGNAVRMEIIPETDIASIQYTGNFFTINAAGRTGTSEPAVIQVLTDKGVTYSSREFVFSLPGAPPVLNLSEARREYDGAAAFTVTGNVSSEAPVEDIRWRIFSKGTIAAEGSVPLDVPEAGSGSFTLEFLPQQFPAEYPQGFSVVEVTAENTEGRTASTAFFVRVPAAVADLTARIPPPAIFWAQGESLYYTVSGSGPNGPLSLDGVAINGVPVQGGIYAEYGAIPPDTPGSGTLTVKVRDSKKKVYTFTRQRLRESSGTLSFESVGSDGSVKPYLPGMAVTLPGGGDTKDGSIMAVIDSEQPVTGVQYSINGGAAVRAAVKRPAAGSTRYEAVLPLKGSLPAERTAIAVTADIRDSASLTGEALIYVVRPKTGSEIIDSEEFRWINDSVNSEGAVILSRDVPMFGYYNGRPLAEAVFDSPDPALDISIAGNSIVLTALSDGIWEPGILRITDIDGHSFNAGPFSFAADSEPPVLTLASPSAGSWIRSEVLVEGSAGDDLSVASVEYSLNGGEWLPLAVSSADSADSTREVSFSQTISLEGFADGLVLLAVRASNSGGKSAVTSRVLNKDTIHPAVTVVIPAADNSINGETTISFLVEDAGKLVSAEYLQPAENDSGIESGIALELGPLITTVVGTAEKPISQIMAFRFTDAAGNVTLHNTWDFIVDQESDLPVVEIHLPAENEVLRSDFVISGIVYDDDGAARVWYAIDDNPFVSLEEYGSSFSISMPLQSLTDNEHFVTVYAEDIHGVTGHHVRRNFRISLEEPKGQVTAPRFDETVKGVVSITGAASDKNGIAKVQISLDNGNTFNDAMGTEEWEYVFDSHVIEDGTHVVFLRIYDNYGIEGLYSSLINIDNTPPDVSLDLPLDDTHTSGPLFLSGFTNDNIGLERVYVRIRNLSISQPALPDDIAEIELPVDAIITKSLDLSVIAEGFYNVEVTGEDSGGNLTRVSRNIEINKTLEDSRIEFLYPLNGEYVQGMFNVYGRVVSEKPVSSLLLYIDGVDVDIAEPSNAGYFKFTVSPEVISSGSHKLVIRGLLEGDKIITSDERYLIYASTGPWITIDNFVMGDFAIERPWIEGSSGYSFTEADILTMRSRETTQYEREQLLAKSIDRVEISFDNGKTFRPAESGRKWRFRVENQDMAEGYHFLVVRGVMKNGEIAVTRSIIQIDKTPPMIRLISPSEGGRFNDGITFSGLSSDDVNLNDVKITLRTGDKASYEVPSFIQGLYLDTHFWGATLYDIGLGLTFFDDNVKLQVQFGQFTSGQRTWVQELLGRDTTNMRYGGNVIGAKLLANLAYIPFSYFLGPDWSWLSASVALGANFSLFTQTQSSKPQMLSAVLAQIEFPRVTIPKQKIFRTFSLYTEVQIWFIPTDVDSSVKITSILPHVSGGIRINVF